MVGGGRPRLGDVPYPTDRRAHHARPRRRDDPPVRDGVPIVLLQWAQTPGRHLGWWSIRHIVGEPPCWITPSWVNPLRAYRSRLRGLVASR